MAGTRGNLLPSPHGPQVPAGLSRLPELISRRANSCRKGSNELGNDVRLSNFEIRSAPAPSCFGKLEPFGFDDPSMILFAPEDLKQMRTVFSNGGRESCLTDNKRLLNPSVK